MVGGVGKAVICFFIDLGDRGARLWLGIASGEDGELIDCDSWT